jgi:hypothetical protein
MKYGSHDVFLPLLLLPVVANERRVTISAGGLLLSSRAPETTSVDDFFECESVYVVRYELGILYWNHQSTSFPSASRQPRTEGRVATTRSAMESIVVLR